MSDLDQHPYGGLPPHSGTDTSLEGARAVAPIAGGLRAKVLAFIEANKWATDDQIAAGTGIERRSAGTRRRELVLLGLVKNSKTKWVTESGRKHVLWTLGKEEEVTKHHCPGCRCFT